MVIVSRVTSISLESELITSTFLQYYVENGTTSIEDTTGSMSHKTASTKNHLMLVDKNRA